MLRLTLKNLSANRVRFAMTTFAVVLAVSFVVSSFVLTDGLRSTFGNLSEEIVEGTDLELRPVDEFGQAELLDPALRDEVAAIDGVATAAGVVEAENSIRPINSAGEAIPIDGPPQLTFGWIDDTELSSFALAEGRAPTAAGEFVMDVDAADNHGFAVGEAYDVLTPTGLTELTLVGLTSFGANNDTLGATLMAMETSALQDVLAIDGYHRIQVSLGDGASRDAVQAEMATLASGTEVVDNATLESEQKADFNEGIDLIGNILLGFAAVSLFVSIFIIYNTFSIVLGQRTKEMALLRTVGADPRQLRRSVQAESLLVGVIASAIGIGAGVLVAFGLRSVFGAIGLELPDSPVIVSMRTIIVAAVVGIGATMASAVGPARRASKVPAIAALRDGIDAGQRRTWVRFALGAVVLAIGVVAGAAGLFAASGTEAIIALLAVGAVGFFVGVTMLSPLVAKPVTGLLGAPGSQAMGVAGKLAQQNAGRNPHRTATTAAALMIGLAMVAMALTVGESVKAELRNTLQNAVQADYLVTEQASDAGFPTTLAAELDALPATDVVTSFRYDEARVAGEIIEVQATDLAKTDALFDLGVTAGVQHDAAVAAPVLVSDEEAEAAGIAVGDVVPMAFASGEARDLTVIGIFADDIVGEENYIVDLATWDEVGASGEDIWLGFSVVDGLTEAEATEALAPVVAAYPQADVDTASEFSDRIEGFVDQALATVNVMVALAVIIALIGIANTLALSLFERTRELGLLRAVGMTRRQLRRMVRAEAGLVALFGATLGVGIGVFFGWAAVLALPADFTSTLAIPVTRILVLVAVAGIAGLIAAWGPARRAAKLDVLDAIAS